jgi:hypothetical protein
MRSSHALEREGDDWCSTVRVQQLAAVRWPEKEFFPGRGPPEGDKFHEGSGASWLHIDFSRVLSSNYLVVLFFA